MTISGAAPLTVSREFYGTLLKPNDRNVQFAPPVLHFVRPVRSDLMGRLSAACSAAYRETPAIAEICDAMVREARTLGFQASLRITTIQADGLQSYRNQPVFLALVLVDLTPVH